MSAVLTLTNDYTQPAGAPSPSALACLCSEFGTNRRIPTAVGELRLEGGMRRVLLLTAAAVMVLVPGGAAIGTAFFPRQGRILPLGFWVCWLLVSLWAAFYAPAVVDRLTPPHRGSHQYAAYARLGIALGVINMVWSVAEIVLLG